MTSNPAVTHGRQRFDIELSREESCMQPPSRTSLVKGALALPLVAWLAGFGVPGYCLDRPVSGTSTNEQVPDAGWVVTGSLNAARVGHTATLLPNGSVLVVGGRDNAHTLDSAEVYDPATGTWSVTGSLNTARISHTATLLQDGKVLVAGGGVPPGLANTAELYDLVTGAWSPTGSLAAAHAGHTATLLPNGKVLVSGGTDNFSLLHTAELYDPATGTWGPAGSPTWSRYSHTATLLQNGSVLVAGGIVGPYDPDIEFPAASYAELYDPVAVSWRNVGTAIRLSDHTATLLPNGKVLMAGGYSVRPFGSGGGAVTPGGAELFDPTGEAWSDTGSLQASTFGHTASLLPNGKVLVAGNIFDGGNHAELYDPDTGMWTSTSNLNARRAGHRATLLPNGKVLVAGGEVADATNTPIAQNSAELYEDGAPPKVIGAGFTGAWYDPAQSGHGLFIEVLTGNRFYASWFAFNPAGTGQSWLTGVGTYSGNTATIASVVMPTGGRWIPNFDPSQIALNPWGTLTFTFTDCDHGRVDFSSVIAGYGSGSMSLTRLTQSLGLSCP